MDWNETSDQDEPLVSGPWRIQVEGQGRCGGGEGREGLGDGESLNGGRWWSDGGLSEGERGGKCVCVGEGVA